MRNGDGEDAAAALIERRWFASIAAVRTTREECEVLRQVMESAEHAWRRARTELVRLELLRDALGEALAERESAGGEPARTGPRRADLGASRAELSASSAA